MSNIVSDAIQSIESGNVVTCSAGEWLEVRAALLAFRESLLARKRTFTAGAVDNEVRCLDLRFKYVPGKPFQPNAPVRRKGMFRPGDQVVFANCDTKAELTLLYGVGPFEVHQILYTPTDADPKDAEQILTLYGYVAEFGSRSLVAAKPWGEA